jgi:hypothetical protein
VFGAVEHALLGHAISLRLWIPFAHYSQSKMARMHEALLVHLVAAVRKNWGYFLYLLTVVTVICVLLPFSISLNRRFPLALRRTDLII